MKKHFAVFGQANEKVQNGVHPISVTCEWSQNPCNACMSRHVSFMHSWVVTPYQLVPYHNLAWLLLHMWNACKEHQCQVMCTLQGLCCVTAAAVHARVGCHVPLGLLHPPPSAQLAGLHASEAGKEAAPGNLRLFC